MGTRYEHLLAALATLNRGSGRRSLAEVGSLVHLSPGRAQRVFAGFVGESPGKYQLRTRLDRAAAELLATDRPIADVAFDNGFGSHEGFTRSFHARFGVSPREYRVRTGRWTATERATAHKTSPCVGLYRVTVDPSTNDLGHKRSEEHSMENKSDQTVEVVEMVRTPVLFMARRIDRDEFASVLGELLPAVFQYVMEQGLPMAGPPYVRYVDQSAAFLSVEAGMPLAEDPKPPESDTGISVGELPAGPAAVTIHTGPYDTLGDTHMVLDRWMAANNRVPTGPPWEVYLTDPGEVPDPKDWQTQIVWPMAETG